MDAVREISGARGEGLKVQIAYTKGPLQTAVVYNKGQTQFSGSSNKF